MEQPFLHMGLADPNVNRATMARFYQAQPGLITVSASLGAQCIMILILSCIRADM